MGKTQEELRAWSCKKNVRVRVQVQGGGLGWFGEGMRKFLGACRMSERSRGTHASSCTEQGSNSSSPLSAGRPGTYPATLSFPICKTGTNVHSGGWLGR